jgi:hypothetical protein
MRGVVFCLVLALAILGSVSAVSAITYNVTTDADGFVLISAPESVGVGGDFSIDVSYYFLNMLVQEANVSIAESGNVIHEASFTPSSESTTTQAVLKESQQALFTYAVRVTEVTETKQYMTEIPFTVKVNPKGFEFDNMTIYRGLVYNDSEAAFEDLAGLEPQELQGMVKYAVVQKLTSQVDCIAQGSTIIFLPAERYLGQADCAVKATVGNASVRYFFKFLVGSKDEAAAFDREHGRTVQQRVVRNLETRGITIIAADENLIATDLATIKITVLPEDITEGMNGRIILDVQATDPIIERIDTIGLLINGYNISNTSCNDTCGVSYDLTYNRPGILPFFTYANFITKRQVGVNATLPSGWKATTSSSNDLFIANDQTHAYVKPRVPDLLVPSVGVVTNLSPDQKEVVDTLLREYQKKTRTPIKMEDEYARIDKVAGSIIVDKSLEVVQRIDPDGRRTQHTIYHIRIIPRKATLLDYAFGMKKVQDVVVIEHISKNAASNLGHVRFQNKSYEIIADDPVVAWKVDILDKPVEFSYEVDRQTEARGNTLIIGDVTRSFPNIVFVIIIPLLIIALIVFDRYRKKPDEEITDLKDRPPSYEELEKDNVVMEAKPSDATVVESVNTMGEFDQLIDGVEDYIARRLAKGDHREYIKQELVKANWPEDIVEKLIVKREQMRNR